MILASGVAQACTLALEAIPATFERRRLNLLLNDLLRSVDARCLAVGPTEVMVRFTACRDTTNRSISLLSARSNESTVEVPRTSLVELLQQANFFPLVWKVDMDG